MYVETNGNGQLYYAYTDHLGSLTALTDKAGKIANVNGTEQRFAYDPWGNRRNPNDWSQLVTTPQYYLTDRGYTLHEHLDGFGLINMNGRVYDPMIARFLSPDPFIQAPGNWLNYNRYGYCYNNPLIYSDPSGEYALIDDLIVMGVGGIVNLGINMAQGNVKSFGSGIGYFVSGAAAAEVTIYAGPVAGGAVLGMGNDLTGQVSQNGWNNINPGQTVFAGFMGGATAYVGGQITSSISPYISGLTSNIASPVIQQAAIQSLTNTTSGFVLGTGVSYLQGNDLNTALRDGGQSALFGLGMGMISGTVSGYKIAEQKRIDPWTGEKLHGHHSDPIFMGGDRSQKRTDLKASTHRRLHKEMNDFLHKQKDAYMNHMRPQSNNSGSDIQQNFTRQQRLNSLQQFYDKNKWIYPRSRYDFYKNNNIKWWIW
jgi:RHS repeat-associated protein